MPPSPAKQPAAVAPVSSPAWLKPVILGLLALGLMAMFSAEISDPDTWIHLAVGKWMVQHHQLPIPDPFQWTSYLGKPVYPDEYFTRDFNLKHEWLGQVFFYLIWAAGGPVGMVLFRALTITALCGVIGWVVYRRNGDFYAAVIAVAGSAEIARSIATDRPFIVTYLLLTLELLILERRRALWLLAPLFAFWSNFHGGYFAGWILLAAYAGETIITRLRGKPQSDERPMLLWCVLGFLAGAVNPTIFGIIPAMFAYRQSFMQNSLREWHVPPLNQLSWYLVFLLGSLGVLIWQRQRARVADWLMYLAFAGLSLMAMRNVIFLGVVGPLIICSYLPKLKPMIAAGVLVILGGFIGLNGGNAFQLRVASWKYPDGAIAFLKQHNVSAPMFNLYEWGGYLMWAAWPQERTFVDGRALNESVFRDYWDVSQNHPNAQAILDKYGVEVLLLEGFEYGTGNVYLLNAMLADPSQTKWKLVYQDKTAMLFMRNPPPGVQPLPPAQVFDSLDAQCSDHLEHMPEQPNCALRLGDFLYPKLGMQQKAAYWMQRYEQVHGR
jgi:hypothetical protein